MSRRTNKKKKSPKRAQHVMVDSSRDVYTVIPQICLQVTRDWKLRFVNQGAAINNVTFTIGQVAAQLGIIATSAVTSVFLTPVYRLKRVQMWGLTGTVSAEFPNLSAAGSALIASPPKPKSDTSQAQVRYAYISMKPPKHTALEGMWWNVASIANALTIISLPVLGVVEFDFQWILDDLGATIPGPAIAAAVLGTIYHQTLSGLTVTGLNPI
jgi:hypothetical protein